MSWTEMPLGEITKILGGGTPSKQRADFWCGEVPWVSPKDMGSREVTETQDHITKAAVAGSATQVVPEGSVLIVVRSGILVRRFPVAIARVPVALNQDLKALLPSALLLSDFLAYFLEISSQRILAECVKRGATVHSIDMGQLERFLVPVPPKSEQRQIVEVLDRARELLRKNAIVRDKIGRVLPALFYEQFGDPATNPKKWPSLKLGEIISETRNGLYKPMEFYGQGISILKMFNILDGQLNLNRVDRVDLTDEEYQSYKLLPGDILLNRVNTPELVGKCAIITDLVGKAVFESKNIRIRVNKDKAHPEFLSALLNLPFGHTLLRNAVKHAIGMATINTADLTNVLIGLPPLSLQENWASTAQKIRSVRQMLASSHEKLSSTYQNISHLAFSGKLSARWCKTNESILRPEILEIEKVIALAKEIQPC